MALVVRNVSVVFGSAPLAIQALCDITLELASSEVTLLKGPSGSGKTTLLSVIGGLLAPGSGTVQVDGTNVYEELRDRRAASFRRRCFGFVFQDSQLFPQLTVLENIRVPLDLDGRPRVMAHQRCMRLLEAVGLADRWNSRPMQLSGGEQQRVAIARALAGDPYVVLADEPTAALDAASGQQIATLLSRTARTFGKTVVIVSHDDRLVPFAQRLVQIVDGRLTRDERVPSP